MLCPEPDTNFLLIWNHNTGTTFYLKKLTIFLSFVNLTKLISVLEQLSCNDDNTRGSVTNLAKRKTGKN